MKNMSCSKKSFLFLFLLSASLFLGVLSGANAVTTGVPTSQLGCPQVINMPLYLTDEAGNYVMYVDPNDHSKGFKFNQLDLYIGCWTTLSIGFSITPNGSEIDWTLDHSKWVLSFPSQDPTLGYALMYSTSSLDNTYLTGYQTLKCSLTALHAGTQQIRVTSPNGGGNGESVAYTMTVNVYNNSPAPQGIK